MSFTLMLTCAGGELMPQLMQAVRASARHDVRIVGVDARPDAVGRRFADVFATVPNGTEPGYVDAVAELVDRHGVDLLLPTSDEEALALSEGRDRVERGGCLLACAPAETLKIVSDKARAYAHLAGMGVPVPHWREATTLDELAAAVDELVAAHGAAVAKPAAGRGGRGVCVIRPGPSGIHSPDGGRERHMDPGTFRDDVMADFASSLPVVVMERLVEPVYDVDMLAWRGRPIRVVPRRRVDSVLPNEGHTFVDDATLTDLGTRLIEGLGLTWLYDCDVMYAEDGRPGILEINPRPSGSVSATIAAGVPLLDDVISLAKGEPVPDVEAPTGRVVVPYKALAVVRP